MPRCAVHRLLRAGPEQRAAPARVPTRAGARRPCTVPRSACAAPRQGRCPHRVRGDALDGPRPSRWRVVSRCAVC